MDSADFSSPTAKRPCLVSRQWPSQLDPRFVPRDDADKLLDRFGAAGGLLSAPLNTSAWAVSLLHQRITTRPIWQWSKGEREKLMASFTRGVETFESQQVKLKANELLGGAMVAPRSVRMTLKHRRRS